jgi:hypothetical protein
MSKFTAPKSRSALLRYTALIVLFPGAFAGVGTANALDLAPIDLETIVVTGTRFNAEIAPAKASLDTTHRPRLDGHDCQRPRPFRRQR